MRGIQHARITQSAAIVQHGVVAKMSIESYVVLEWKCQVDELG